MTRAADSGMAPKPRVKYRTRAEPDLPSPFAPPGTDRMDVGALVRWCRASRAARLREAGVDQIGTALVERGPDLLGSHALELDHVELRGPGGGENARDV